MRVMAKQKVKMIEELEAEILETVSTSPKMLEKLCEENPHWPRAKYIYAYRIKNPEFGKKYAIAKQCQIEPLVDSMMHMLEEDPNDFYEDNNGVHVNTAKLQKIRMKIDTIKWFASKLAPKIYGDKVKTDTTVTYKTHEEALRELE
jgi:hypothetical protein